MWDLLRSGIEPLSPALERRFCTSSHQEAPEYMSKCLGLISLTVFAEELCESLGNTFNIQTGRFQLCLNLNFLLV